MGRPYKYFSTFVKVNHLLRDLSRKYYLSWLEVHNNVVYANKYGKHIMPRCVAGRWGSTSGMERELTVVKPSIIAPVIILTLTSKNNVSEDELAKLIDKAAKCVDDVSFEATVAFMEMRSRWRKLTLVPMRDTVF
eukprot:11844332-Karenia_brevis.AAC.1